MKSKKRLNQFILSLVLLSFPLGMWAQSGSISRTPWEMHSGLEVTTSNPYGVLPFNSQGYPHGWSGEYAVATIPGATDPGWGAAPNGETIGFTGQGASGTSPSLIDDAGYGCQSAVDFTYFQTFVNVPSGTAVTQFTINFSGMDDGSRITIYNANYPSGVVDPGSYVYLGGSGTADLAGYVTEGQNRVVVTQVDDCPGGNQLQSAVVTLNGQAVQTVCTPTEQTFTIFGANGNVGDIDPYSQSLPAGATEWQPVYLTGGHPWGLIPGTNSWVNFDASNTVGLNTRTPYRIRFEVPADFSNPSMVFNLKADNRALIWINDTFIDSVDGQGSPSIDATIAEPALHPGVNEIRLMMVDWGGIVSFNYRIDVTMTSCENIADAVLTPDEAAVLNNAPTADAGLDQTSEITSITLDGSGSSDPDGNLLSYSWSLNGTEIATGVSPTISLADGSYTLVLTVSDGELNDTDEVNIVVATNQPPVADAGADQTFSCIVGGTNVSLDGSASSDADGDALTYSWSLGGSEVSSAASFTDSLGGGVYAYLLTVSDGQAEATDTVVVTIITDDEAPVITLAGANPDSVVCLYSYADPGASVADNCDANPAMTVTSTVDTSLVGEYTITYSAVDASGNPATAVRTVKVINNAPVVDNPVGEVVLSYGDAVLSTTIDLNGVFSDPDSHVLSYSAAIADPSVATIGLSGSELTVTLGSLGSTTVTVTADDACGGTVQDVFTVIINVTGDLAESVLFSLTGTDMNRGIDVTSGNVIVNDIPSSSSNHHDDDDEDDDDDHDDHGSHHDDDDDDDDDHGDHDSDHNGGSQYQLKIGRNVTTPAGYSIRANAIKIERQSSINGDAYYNELNNRGSIAGTEVSPIAIPQFVNLPPFAPSVPGTQNIRVQRNQSQTLDAGDYGKIEIKQRGTLLLTGGVYNVRELKVGERASLLFAAGAEVRILRRLTVDERAVVGPSDDATITAADILLIVTGVGSGNGHGHDDDDHDNNNIVTFDHNSTISANVFALSGSLRMKEDVVATGAFWAQDIRVHNNVTLTLDSHFALGGGNLAKSTLGSPAGDAGNSIIPAEMALLQNYPNPFNPNTTIAYNLPQGSGVNLKVYDITGRLVETLVQGYQPAGSYRVQFGNSQLSSGTYIYVLEAGSYRNVKRMVFLK